MRVSVLGVWNLVTVEVGRKKETVLGGRDVAAGSSGFGGVDQVSSPASW